MRDGSTLERLLTHPPGHDKNPLSDDQLHAKFRDLVAPVLGSQRELALWNRLRGFATDPRPWEVLSLLSPPGSVPVACD
jgi:2-methylcitrate dehydratase